MISPDDLDPESLRCLRNSETKVELVYGWVLHHIMDSVGQGVLTTPPPLLTRAFQELGSGLVHLGSPSGASSEGCRSEFDRVGGVPRERRLCQSRGRPEETASIGGHRKTPDHQV